MKDTVNEAAAQKAAGGSRLKDGGGHGALIALGVTGGLLAALAAHAVGVYYGSKNAERINQGILKKGVAVFSIVTSILCLLAYLGL